MRERFNTVAVAIPAQIFYVRCHVSIDRQVPVMTDFAVRLLHLSGPMEVSAIREYFGLSAGQLRDLLDILREEGLVGEANGRISLTSYAESRFAVSEDGLPRFTKIAERQSRPIFELLSYTPLPKVLANNYWDNALELKWDENSDVAGKTIERAEAAFHKHFLDIERLEFEDEKRRAYSCYKVDDIRAGRPFSIPLPVHFEVDIEGNVEFEIDAQLELLPESLRSQVRTLTADRISTLSTYSDHLRTFVEYFNDELLARYLHNSTEDKNKGVVINAEGKIGLRREATIDFAKYVRDVHGQANGEVYESGKSKAVLGALYMPKNQTRLLDELRKSLSSIKKSRNTGMPQAIFWVIPDSELWGRTSLVRDLVNGIQAVFQDTFDSPKEITAIAPCHQGEHRDHLFKRAHHLIDAGFSRVILSPYQPKHQCVEVLLIPGVFGVATYHWKTPNATRYNVPFGFLTQSQAKLQKMAIFTMSTLSASLHKVSRGNSNTPDDRRFKLEDAVVSEFVFLDQYIGSSRAPIT